MNDLLKIFAFFTIFSAAGQETKGPLYLKIETKQKINFQFLKEITYDSSFQERSLLDKQIDSLKTQIIQNGYIDLQTSVQQKNDSTITALFDFGVFYETLQLSLNRNALLKQYIKDTGFDIRNDSVTVKTAFAKAYLKQLASVAANSGNPFGGFQITNISKNGAKLTGILTLSNNQTRSIDQFILKGYEDFPKGFFKYYARLKTGIPFNQKKLLKQNEVLQTLPFVSAEKDPEILFRQDSTIAYYYLKRNTVNRFDGFLGFTSDDNNNLILNGYLDLLLINNLNFGESLSLNYKADGNDQSQLRIKTSLPYLFNSPLGVEGEIALFRRDSTFSTSNLSTTLFYTASPVSTIGIGYFSTNSENLNNSQEQSIERIVNFESRGITGSYSYTQRQQDFFAPTKTQLLFTIGYSQRNSSSNTQQQIPLEIDVQHTFKLNSTNSLYVRNSTQYLKSDGYITNELFRFGGIQSIRGFEENSLFANLVSVLNTEYRLTLNPSLYVNSIVDLAYFENQISDQQIHLFSAGFGAGIRTKAGLLKMILANGKFENIPFRLNNTQLHLMLEVSF